MATLSPVLLLPVKSPARGKSRLTGRAPEDREALARAFAQDTLEAALSVEGIGRVVVLTTDESVAEAARAAGAEARPDAVPGDLNATLTAATAEVASGHPVIALCADLPSLRGSDLSRLLAEIPVEAEAFVPDAAGSGTTTYVAPTARFAPRFGPGSAQAHRDAGATPVGLELARLRADVDDAAALERAAALGLGPHTAAVMGS